HYSQNILKSISTGYYSKRLLYWGWNYMDRTGLFCYFLFKYSEMWRPAKNGDCNCTIRTGCYQSGREFYFGGCGWKPKKLCFSADEFTWLTRICGLFDMLFGPDRYEFKTSNKCLIIPKHCRPKIAYDHGHWEDQYKATNDMECNQSSLRCSLMDRYEKTVVETPILQPRPAVPVWGRTASLDENIIIKLINTCPIDNYLTIFYLYLRSHPAVLNNLIEYALPPVKPTLNVYQKLCHLLLMKCTLLESFNG
ncbi:Hypothetical predicted protein, partial [Paramuricea clavata]